MAEALKSGQLTDSNSDDLRTTGQVGRGFFRTRPLVRTAKRPVAPIFLRLNHMRSVLAHFKHT